MASSETSDFEFGSSGIGNIEQDLINGFDILSQEHTSKQSSDYFYIWDIGYKCLRRKYYSIIDPKEVGWELRKRFMVGSGIHSEVQKAMSAVGYDIEIPNKKYYDDFGFTVSTRIDAIKDDRIVEIKSAAFFKFINKPYASNVAQLQMYIDAMNVDVGYLLYIDNVTGAMKEFEVARDDNLIIENLIKLEVIKDCIEFGGIPKRHKSYMCKECEYKVGCDEYGR